MLIIFKTFSQFSTKNNLAVITIQLADFFSLTINEFLHWSVHHKETICFQNICRYPNLSFFHRNKCKEYAMLKK